MFSNFAADEIKIVKEAPMGDDKVEKDYERITSFLNLILGLCVAAMVGLLIPTVIPGSRLPISLPFTLTEEHSELSFSRQIVILAGCSGAILILQLIGLWKHNCKYFHRAMKILTAIILAFALLTIVSAGRKILKNPHILKSNVSSLSFAGNLSLRWNAWCSGSTI